MHKGYKMKDDAMICAELERQNSYLRAIIALLARQTSGGDKVELLLAEFGLGNQDIGRIVGKKPDAVRMLLKRSKNPKNL